MEYTIQVAGLTRHLPLCPVHENLTIAAFVIFGDVELSIACARDLLKIAPDHDVLITAESKGIPLVYEMARQNRENRYLIARKANKLYMKNVQVKAMKLKSKRKSNKISSKKWQKIMP